ncbi:MAG: DUF2934 domain-containing protein [Chthoniobacter sp.]|nr:DUF2934 domain-containing protein [Chthoniobacter sp.]
MNSKQDPTPTGTGIAAPEPTPKQIALCAYAIWEREGRPEGLDAEHWQQAEVQLRETCAKD